MLIYSPDTALLANLSDDGVGGDAALVVFVTRHVHITVHAPILAPAVLDNPESGRRLTAGCAGGVRADLRVVRAAGVRLARLFEQAALAAAARCGGGAGEFPGLGGVAIDVGGGSGGGRLVFAGLGLANGGVPATTRGLELKCSLRLGSLGGAWYLSSWHQKQPDSFSHGD